ncbi:MAG TPA: hypothetical protein VGB83_06275 [Actinomycetota bacterium]
MNFTGRARIFATVLALAATLGSCDYLKDAEPFTATVFIALGPDGRVQVTPSEIRGDWRVGEITVVNDTNDKHGFAIRELAVFEEIPAGLTRVVRVTDVKDDTTYVIDDHLHDESGPEWQVKLVVDFKSEEFR